MFPTPCWPLLLLSLLFDPEGSSRLPRKSLKSSAASSSSDIFRFPRRNSASRFFYQTKQFRVQHIQHLLYVMMVISNTFMPALMHLLYLQLMQFLVSSVTRQLLVPDRHLEGIRDDHHWHHQLHHCSYHRHDCNCTNTLAILLQLFFWCFFERKPYKSNSSGLRKKQI